MSTPLNSVYAIVVLEHKQPLLNNSPWPLGGLIRFNRHDCYAQECMGPCSGMRWDIADDAGQATFFTEDGANAHIELLATWVQHIRFDIIEFARVTRAK